MAATESESLRKVEKDVLIAKKMREKAKLLCSDYVKSFEECCKGRTLSMVFSCRKENEALKSCIASYYTDQAFFEDCKAEYLQERKEFLETGQRPQKLKRM